MKPARMRSFSDSNLANAVAQGLAFPIGMKYLLLRSSSSQRSLIYSSAANRLHNEGDKQPPVSSGVPYPSGPLNSFKYDVLGCREAFSPVSTARTRSENAMFLSVRWAAFVTSRKIQGAKPRARPIDAIPIEIFILIFEQYCRAWRSTETPILPQICITQVCRHWRSIVVNLARLWTKLIMSPQTPFHIVSTYLRRSQQLSLDLEIDLRHDVADATKREHVLTTWRMVKSSAARWRRLILQIGPHDAAFISDDLRELRAPLLEELQISSASQVSGISKIFEGCTPSLKTLRLIGMSLERFNSSLHCLTSLNLTSNCAMHFSVFQSLLKTMVRLQELTLRSRVVECWPLYPSEEDMISLPALTILRLSDRRWPLFIPLLSISAPTLHTLSLYELVAHDLPESTMESQFRENYPSVRNLILKGKSSYIDNVSFRQLARIFPNIDHFALLGVDEFFVRESSRAMHETTIWPKLRTISMMPVAAEDMLCSLISARTTPTTNTPLKTLIVPVPTQFKRIGWMAQQVGVEECSAPSSFSLSHITSESTFAGHQCSDFPTGVYPLDLPSQFQ